MKNEVTTRTTRTEREREREKVGVCRGTTFVEISPLWHHFKSLWRFLVLGQKFETTWANCFVIGVIFIVVNGQKLSKYCGHLVILRGGRERKMKQNV